VNLRVYKPEIFQGNLKKRNYFEGWYFKHVSSDLDQVWSFIPGISLTKDGSCSFIQIINGITGDSEYVSYPVNDFFWERNTLHLKIGKSVFTEKFIDLDIQNKKFTVRGHLDYSNNVVYPAGILSPGIMGWYSFVPFMECKHAIVSANHSIAGSITVNGDETDFIGGKGYIEKDWGTSFPEAWLWVQANNFKDTDSSFSFSVAKIPWLGKFFIGFIAFLYYKNKFLMFSTYNKSALTEIKHSSGKIEFILRNKSYHLIVSVLKSTFGELRAPVSGTMSRRIKESIDSEVTINLFDINNNLIYNDTSRRAGLEVVEKIFEYLKSDF
jgi:tocopherol cyclase